MKSDNNNGGGDSALLLEEADQLAKSWNWTRPFALYIMFCKAMAVGDKMRAEACMNVLEQEVMKSLADPLFGSQEKKMMMSAETRFTVTLIAIGAGTITAEGLGAMGPFSKRLKRG